MFIWGSIGYALAMKIGGEAIAHDISKTQKWSGEIQPGEGDIKIKKIKWVPNLNLGK